MVGNARPLCIEFDALDDPAAAGQFAIERWIDLLCVNDTNPQTDGGADQQCERFTVNHHAAHHERLKTIKVCQPIRVGVISPCFER